MLLHLEVKNILHPSNPGRPLDRLSKKQGYLLAQPPMGLRQGTRAESNTTTDGGR